MRNRDCAKIMLFQTYTYCSTILRTDLLTLLSRFLSVMSVSFVIHLNSYPSHGKMRWVLTSYIQTDFWALSLACFIMPKIQSWWFHLMTMLTTYNIMKNWCSAVSWWSMLSDTETFVRTVYYSWIFMKTLWHDIWHNYVWTAWKPKLLWRLTKEAALLKMVRIMTSIGDLVAWNYKSVCY